MCARFAFFSNRLHKDEFGIVPLPDLTPHWNIAPTDLVAAISVDKGQRVWRFYQWGFDSWLGQRHEHWPETNQRSMRNGC